MSNFIGGLTLSGIGEGSSSIIVSSGLLWTGTEFLGLESNISVMIPDNKANKPVIYGIYGYRTTTGETVDLSKLITYKTSKTQDYFYTIDYRVAGQQINSSDNVPSITPTYGSINVPAGVINESSARCAKLDILLVPGPAMWVDDVPLPQDLPGRYFLGYLYVEPSYLSATKNHAPRGYLNEIYTYPAPIMPGQGFRNYLVQRIEEWKYNTMYLRGQIVRCGANMLYAVKTHVSQANSFATQYSSCGGDVRAGKMQYMSVPYSPTETTVVNKAQFFNGMGPLHSIIVNGGNGEIVGIPNMYWDSDAGALVLNGMINMQLAPNIEPPPENSVNIYVELDNSGDDPILRLMAIIPDGRTFEIVSVTL